MPNDDLLVERVARAINDVVIESLVPFREFEPTDCARAAIAAIEAAGYVVVPREPTDMMLQAGYYASPDDAQDTWYVDELGTWRAMLDAALKKETASNE